MLKRMLVLLLALRMETFALVERLEFLGGEAVPSGAMTPRRDEVVGWVSGYIPPAAQATWFLWQRKLLPSLRRYHTSSCTCPASAMRRAKSTRSSGLA